MFKFDWEISFVWVKNNTYNLHQPLEWYRIIRSSLAGYKSNTEQFEWAIFTTQNIPLAGYKIQEQNSNNNDQFGLIQNQYRTIPDSCEPYKLIQILQGMIQIDPKPSLQLDTSVWLRRC